MKYLVPVVPYLVPLFWGFGGYLAGIVTSKSPTIFTGFFWTVLGSVILSLPILLATNFQDIRLWQWRGADFLFGLWYPSGTLIFVIAIALSGSATKTVALSALYPAVTALLLFLLQGEPLSLKKIIGVILAVVVGWLMA